MVFVPIMPLYITTLNRWMRGGGGVEQPCAGGAGLGTLCLRPMLASGAIVLVIKSHATDIVGHIRCQHATDGVELEYAMASC